MDDIKLFKHRIKIKVRFSDLDAMRHVNNATYLSYLEEARISYFADVLQRTRNDLNFGAVVARIEIDYLQPLIFGEEIAVLSRVSMLGNKSSEVRHLIVVYRGGAEVIAASAVTKLVSYDYKTLKSAAIPDDVKKKIKDFEGL